MGTYLSKPVTDKVSQDMENDRVLCGASSMQGWRESQEDSHNCILNFDRKISLFAVYDGHGGAEVAQYASSKLPSMVKNKFYKNREFENALKTAYLDFDDSLLEPPVVDELTSLREQFHEGDGFNDDDVEEEDKVEELSELYEEAKMPIEQIIMKYKNKIIPEKDIIDKDDQTGLSDKDDQPGSSDKDDQPGLSDKDDQPGSSDKDDQPGSSKECCSKSSSQSSNLPTSDEESDSDDEELEKNNDICGGSCCSIDNNRINTKINGAPKNDIGCCGAECGPSSSNGRNGNGKKYGTASLILDDSESDDSDDDIFEVNKTDESEEEDRDDSDSDSDEDEDDDPLLFSADYDDDDEEKAGKDSGCTAVMALLIKRKLYVANAGDSRCVVSVDGRAHDMSKDHKPEDELEYKRICAAGGRVSSDGRVNGGLNLSRALGDHNYKKNKALPNTDQMITALPDLSFLDLKKVNADFIVLACDGIWNSLSSQEVVDFILERINKPNVKLSSICEELFDKCLAPNTLSDGTGCDNMTCIIVKLKPKKKRLLSEGDNSGESSRSKRLRTEHEVNHEPEPEPVREPEPVHEQGIHDVAVPIDIPELESAHEPEIRHAPKPDLILETEAALQSAAASSAYAGSHASEASSESEAEHESESSH